MESDFITKGGFALSDILDQLNEPGDFYEGTVVDWHESAEEPSHYGVLIFDDGNTVDLDHADNLRREVDGILDAYYDEDPFDAPRLRIVRIDPDEVARPDKGFTPKFAHAVILVQEGE